MRSPCHSEQPLALFIYTNKSGKYPTGKATFSTFLSVKSSPRFPAHKKQDIGGLVAVWIESPKF
jgi:hypothetical protein